MPLNNMPTEILYEIAQGLNSERDLSALTRTCRLLYFHLTHLLYSNNVQHHDSAALFWAAKKGQPQTAHRMIDAGADLQKIRDCYRKTPLHYAAFFGHRSVAEMLIDNGAELTSFDGSGMSPLHCAVGQSHTGIAKLLLSKEFNPDLHRPGIFSYTPLHVAAKRGRDPMVKLLLDHGADVNLKGTMKGATALHWALQPCIENGMSILDPNLSTIRHSWKENKKTYYGDFLAHQATALALIEMGADLDSKDAHFETCFMLAVRGGYVVVVQRMLEKGVDWSFETNATSSDDIACLDEMLSLLRLNCTEPE